MNAWEIHSCDLGRGPLPVVIVSHPARAARRDFVELRNAPAVHLSRMKCVSMMPTVSMDRLFANCDCIFAVPRGELTQQRGVVSPERRRQIVRTIIQSHGWNLL